MTSLCSASGYKSAVVIILEGKIVLTIFNKIKYNQVNFKKWIAILMTNNILVYENK